MAKVKIKVGDQLFEGETVDYQVLNEPWSTYRTEDGTTLKMRLVVSGVIKLPQPDPITGLPQYAVQSSNVLAVEPATPKGEQH